MDVVTGVELECSYGAGDGRTRSRVVSMPKERSGGPRLDWSCNWEKYGYDRDLVHSTYLYCLLVLWEGSCHCRQPLMMDLPSSMSSLAMLEY